MSDEVVLYYATLEQSYRELIGRTTEAVSDVDHTRWYDVVTGLTWRHPSCGVIGTSSAWPPRRCVNPCRYHLTIMLMPYSSNVVSAFTCCGCYGTKGSPLQWSDRYSIWLFVALVVTRIYGMSYRHGVWLHLSVRSVELMPFYARHISVAFPKTWLHFMIYCMIPVPCYLRKCSSLGTILIHCCHPKRLQIKYLQIVKPDTFFHSAASMFSNVHELIGVFLRDRLPVVNYFSLV